MINKQRLALCFLAILLLCVLSLAACKPETPVSTAGSTATTAPESSVSSSAVTQPTQTLPTQPSATEHPHSLGDWTVVQESTCGLPELSRRSCACGYYEEQITQMPSGEHSYDEDGQCTGCDRKVSVGLFYKRNEDGESYTVIGIGSCEDTVVVIPEIYNGKPVTAIRDMAFASIGNEPSLLECITIPATVTSIGKAAFAGCHQLTEIHVEEGGEHFVCIDSILYTKDAKTLLIYPGGKLEESFQVPEHVQSIGDFAFSYSIYLKTVALPDSVTHIGTGAFSNSSLQSILFGAGMQTIGPQAFAMCMSFTDIQVSEQNTVFMSRDGVLLHKDGSILYVYPAGKEDLSYTVPEGVKAIAPEAFYGCRSLQTVTLADSLLEIGEGAFFDCGKLKEIHLGTELAVISRHAFAWCDLLEVVTMQEKVTTIGQGAFYGCASLAELTLPESVAYIGQEAFDGCAGLKKLIYSGSIQQWCQFTREEAWDGLDTDYTLYCSDMTDFSTGLEYRLSEDGTYVLIGIGTCTDSTIVVPALHRGILVTAIADYAFSGTAVAHVVLPDSVTNLGGACFADCLKLQSVSFGKGLTQVGAYAFKGCFSLEEILVPEENTAFRSVDGVLFSLDGKHLLCYPAGRLEDFYSVPEGTVTIGDHAFFDCDNLVSVILPEDLEMIGLEAFSDCDRLESIALPESLTVISQEAFFDCDALLAVTFNGTLEQWNGIRFGKLWDANTPRFTITCVDGEVDLDYWTVIGTFGGDNWVTDIAMEEKDGLWITLGPIAMEAGDTFRCRLGGRWEEAVPDEEFVVETAGSYYIQLDPASYEITLIPAEA